MGVHIAPCKGAIFKGMDMPGPTTLCCVRCVKMAERKHALDGGAHWRLLVNSIEPSMCGGEATFFQITLTTYYYHHLNY